MKKGLKIIGAVLIAFVVLGFFMKGSDKAIHEAAKEEMQHVENQVAEDAVKQYEIAKRNGNAIDAYTAASMVCAAYLQAKDEPNYKKWKEIEKQEAAAAGMPQQ